MELNQKQKRFVQEYLIDLNATQAAIRAGYSKDTAYSQGQRLLKDVEIQRFLKEALDNRSRRTEITADMVLAELARVGFSNMSNYAVWDGNGVDLIPSNRLTEDASRCVAEVTQHVTAEGGTVKFKLHDKVGALEKIARHLGMFNDKLNIGGQSENPLMLGGKIEIELVKPSGDN